MSNINVKSVGHLTGLDGTGVVYELEENGVKTLAMIWSDGKFHELSKADFLNHVSQSKATLTASLADNYQTMSLNNVSTAGFARFFTADTTVDNSTDNGQTDAAINTKIEIPFKFEGKFTLDLSQVKDLLSILITD